MPKLSDRPFPDWTPKFGERVSAEPRGVFRYFVRVVCQEGATFWQVTNGAGSFWLMDPRAAERVEPAESAEGKLRDFAQAVMRGFPDYDGLDGFDLQDLAVKYGLLTPVEVTEPCQPEGCWCAEYHGDSDGGVTCYRRTALLTGESA